MLTEKNFKNRFLASGLDKVSALLLAIFSWIGHLYTRVLVAYIQRLT